MIVMFFSRSVAGFALSSLSVAVILVLAACAGDGKRGMGGQPTIEGRMLHAPETFTGKSTAGIEGDGSISLLSDRGTHCDGPYRQVPNDHAGERRAGKSSNGLATLTCSDGRKGSVMFTIGPDEAIGTGMLGQDILTLTMR